MKKSKIIKLLVSALSLCLIIGAMVGITAMAEETEPTNPEIVSYNVSYSDELYLFYAVKATLAEGENIYLQICDENGNALEDGTDMDIVNPDKPANLSKITDWEIKTIYGEDYYVFVTNGVSAKDINKVEYVKAVITGGEADRESEIVEYSVLNYLYQRLYKDGVAGATEKEDLLRKDLYQSLVAYGAAAQELLFPEEGITEFDSIRDTKYYFIEGNSYIHYEDFDVVYPRHDETITDDGEVFYGWNVFAYAADGSVISDGSAVYADAARVNVAGAKGVYAKPVFAAADAEVNVVAGEAGPEGVVDFNSEYSDLIHVTSAASVTSSIENSINGDGYLSLNKVTDSSGAPSTLNVTYTEVDANVAELSMKLYVGLGSNTNPFEIALYYNNTKTWWFYFNAATASSYSNITAYAKEDGKNVGKSFNLSTPIEMNEWVDIKFVCVNGAYGVAGNILDSKGPYVEVYVNGVLSTIIDRSYNAAETPSAFTYATLNLNGSAAGTMLLDDIFVGLVKKDVVAEPDYTLNFNAPITSSQGSVGGSSAENDRTYGYVDSVTDGAGVTKENVLHLHKGNSTNMNVLIAPTYVEDNANTAVMEFDVYATDGDIQLHVKNTAEKSPYCNYIFTASEVKNWVHIKVVYTAPAEEGGVGSLTITVGDAAPVTKSCRANSSDGASPSIENFGGIHLYLNSSAIGDYYFDNFKVSKLCVE